MRVILFYHSLLSDWNHGNAHFLRGVVNELLMLGHDVHVYEPESSWSYNNLISNYGEEALKAFSEYYPQLTSNRYPADKLDLDITLDKADLVIVHEWNDYKLVKDIGDYRKLNTGFKLLFHDTHHRSASEPDKMNDYDLSNYDGVLAFGEVIKNIYLNNNWIQKAWTWHEAADIRIFHPYENVEKTGDLVWIGNWGDDERSKEIFEFFINPSEALKLNSAAYGVRYPQNALETLRQVGIKYNGWVPNYKVPEIFAGFKVTVHVPRKYYTTLLPGIPTIRPFEALACGILLISAPWNDTGNLFTAGKDYITVNNGEEMTYTLKNILNDNNQREEIAMQGMQTILQNHTCAHRVHELLNICRELGINVSTSKTTNYLDKTTM
jgi:spore maturation protein CgeB